MKKMAIILLVLVIPLTGFGQDSKDTVVKWYDLSRAVSLNKENPKKIFIYVYSDNCGWCRRMAGNTLTNQVIDEYLNDKYYPVKINTNITEDIHFGNRTYKYVPADPVKGTPAYHEFVVAILQGSLAYPSTVFFDRDLRYLGVVKGYKNPPDFEKLLHFIGDDAYLENNDFEKYAATFTGKL
jgi:thioredoxin-related protein